MTITTYATLKSAVADFLNREDLTSAIPTFIAFAESAHRRDIRDRRMITRASLTLDAQFEALPTDWLETIRITIDANPVRELQQASLSDIAFRRTGNVDTTGAPVMFAHIGSDIELWPTPNESYTAQITYYAKATALSADSDTNWLLSAAPDAYLYGALMHSAPYLKDDARITVWASLYSAAIKALNTTSDDAKFGGTGLVMKTKRGAP